MRKLTMLLVMVLTGCAKSPESIAPAYVSPNDYAYLDCKQLSEEHMRVSRALGRAASQQYSAREGDAMGVLFLGLPVASLSGENVAPQIADLKGQQDAINRAKLDKHC